MAPTSHADRSRRGDDETDGGLGLLALRRSLVATLWRLAEHWYDGRLDHGYVRREPAEAARYLRGVGLSGEFWGRP